MPKNVISFMNMKGGVGKTTVCVNIAGQLAHLGKTVLLIDIDPQMNASQYLLKTNILDELLQNQKTIYSLYKSDVEDDLNDITGDEYEDIVNNDTDDIIIKDVKPCLDLICGDLNMTKVKDDGTISDILANYLSKTELKKHYDFVFIDCPPTQSVYTTSAFKASDFYILVIKPDYISTIGISLFNRMLNKYNKNRASQDKLKNLGIIANLMQKSNDNYHESKLEEVKNKFKFSNDVFHNNLSNSANIAKASEKQLLMYETNGCKQPIKKLTNEFLENYNRRVK